jgi:hypothetical protein
MRAFAWPGHWFGPVTRLGQLGPAQPIWLAKSNPILKKIKGKKTIYIVSLSFNPNFKDLFTGVRVRNTVLFCLHNIYQHQS